MTIPIIAAVAGAVLVILQAILMILVGMHRIRNRINLGTGDDPALERKIRRHGNLVAGSQGAETGKIFQAFRAIGAFATFGSFIALGGYLLAGIF